MMIHELKAQGRKYQKLPNLGSVAGSWMGSKLRLFAHACAVSALSIEGHFTPKNPFVFKKNPAKIHINPFVLKKSRTLFPMSEVPLAVDRFIKKFVYFKPEKIESST